MRSFTDLSQALVTEYVQRRRQYTRVKVFNTEKSTLVSTTLLGETLFSSPGSEQAESPSQDRHGEATPPMMKKRRMGEDALTQRSARLRAASQSQD